MQWPEIFLSLKVTVDLGPWFHKQNACLSCARDADRHHDVGVLMLHYQVAIELGYYRHVQYMLALMYAKDRKIVFCSFLYIRENVLLDIPENVE